MAAGRTITRLVITVAWPLVQKHIWPLIQAQMAALAAKGFHHLSALISRKLHRNSSVRSTAAEKKAKEAETLAETASTEVERVKYEAVAKVWREVAEQFRVENEELKAQINSMVEQQQERLESDLLSASPTLEKRGEETVLEINGKYIALPAPQQPDE